MNKKVLVTGTSVRRDLLRPLDEAGYQIFNPEELLSEQDLRRELADSVAYLVGGDEFASKTAMSDAADLKIIAFLGVGYESFIDAKAAADFGIPVTNTPGTLSTSVAEFTVGQVLNATRRLTVYGGYFRNPTDAVEQKRHDLSSMSVGLIGLGAIGTKIAETLTRGFSVSLSYFSRTRKLEEETRLGISFKPLGDLMASSQLVIVMVPGNNSTKSLLGRTELSALPKGAILVNTARPDVVDSSALLEGLRSGQIETAVFDDFYNVEAPETPELSALSPERLLVTRHIASLTHEARDGMAKKAVRSILNILETGKDDYIVNRT